MTSAARRASEFCLEARGLRFAYPRRATDARAFVLELDELQLRWNESLACVGASGHGKTTLAMLLAGVYAPERGDVRFDGASLSSLADAARRAVRVRRFGLVFQELELIPWLDARDNIVLPFRTTQELALTDAVWERVHVLAERIGVAALLRRRPAELSQGERQRIAICRALVHEPDLVFCDEPTGNLDPRSARACIELLREDCAARGASFFCITHDHALLDSFDRVFDVEDASPAASPAS